MTSFLTSMLVRECASMGEEAFLQRYSHDWILWEPGAWTPPLKPATIAAPAGKMNPSTAGVALAFILKPKPDKPEITLGRGKDCDLEINDGTLSTLHLIFTPANGSWSVRDAGSKNGASMGGVYLVPKKPVPLKNGDRMACGQVNLTFYTARGLVEQRLTKK